MTSRTPQQASVTTLTGSTKVQLRSGSCAAPLAAVEAPHEAIRAEARRPGGEVIRWRHAAVVMRGWRPRAIGPARRSWWAWLSAAMAGVLDRIAEHQEWTQSRRDLLNLDDRTLRDLGIDRATAHYLGGQPFWRRHE